MAERTLTGILAGAGEQSAQQMLTNRQARQTSQNIPSFGANFGVQLMDLLKQSQGLGTRKFQEAAISGQEEQIRRLKQTPSELIGASPALQSTARGAAVGAVEPTITGAKTLGKTFSEQLASFGTGIDRALAVGTWMQEQADKEKQEKTAKKVEAFNIIAQFPEVVKQLSDEQRRGLESAAGLEKGFLNLLPEPKPVKKDTEIVEVGNRKLLIDSQTGETIKDLGIVPSRITDIKPLKPLSGDAAKVYSITTTIVPEINSLKEAFKTNYKKALTGIVSKTDRRLVKLVDNIADKVGRLRSGGAINKDEETRFKRQIASILDIPFGKGEEAIAALDGILAEAESIAQSIRPQNSNIEIEIPVRIKSSKETGWILESEFDPNLYEKL